MSNINRPNLPLPNPDFDSIRDNLKTYLKSQDELKDYDFDGSTLAVLLDVLAYNSSMNSFMLNMVGNESHLSSAVRRSSIVSHAQDLGYTPASAKSSKVYMYVEYNPQGDISSGINIPTGTVFASMSSGISYAFNTTQDHFAEYNKETGKYTATNVEAHEGIPFTHKYTITAPGQSGTPEVPDAVSSIDNIGITIPNLNVDVELLSVTVKDPSVSTEYEYYSKYKGDLHINERSKVYFVSENETGHTNIKFGNGIIGIKPGLGSIIRVNYIVSSGPIANGIALFNQTSPINNAILHKAVALAPSNGGAWAESNESIQFNAPLSWETQNRGVLASDYEFLTRQAYPSAKSVIAWGGEDNDPPVYGRVFITVQPTDGTVISQSDKASIERYLLSKGSITTKPILIDPDYVYLDITSHVYYNPQKSKRVGGELEALVANTIREYSNVVLSTFKSSLIFSKFIGMIDNIDSGITMNETSISLGKRFYINHDVKQQSVLSFSNEIKHGTIMSSRFTFGGFNNSYIGSYGSNGLAIFTQRAGKTSMIASDAGTVDYAKGIVTINPIKIQPSDDRYFDGIIQKHYVAITATPQSGNAFTNKNQILRVDNIRITSENIS